jgi:2-polyprenyl-6-methoxyphenol hydroxylase-like FAD-dependent oxidoreductase
VDNGEGESATVPHAVIAPELTQTSRAHFPRRRKTVDCDCYCCGGRRVVLGDAAHGFPYLSGVGRLIIKDAIMFGGAIVTLADSARAYLRRSN